MAQNYFTAYVELITLSVAVYDCVFVTIGRASQLIVLGFMNRCRRENAYFQVLYAVKSFLNEAANFAGVVNGTLRDQSFEQIKNFVWMFGGWVIRWPHAIHFIFFAVYVKYFTPYLCRCQKVLFGLPRSVGLRAFSKNDGKESNFFNRPQGFVHVMS